MIEDEAALLSDIRFPLRGLNPWPRLERFRNLGCDAVRSRTREGRRAGYHPFSTQLGEADLLVGSCSAATRSGSSSPPMERKVPSSLSQKKSITAKLVFACR
jgi:hypothetical protein